jgi:hypothetical protein
MAIENIGKSDPTELKLNNFAKDFLKETARWAGFLSILGFIGIGLLVIIALFFGTVATSLSNSFSGAFGGGFITVFYLLLALLYFFPVYFLYQFSSNMKKALARSDQDTLTKGFEYLKSHYKFVGILAIVMLSLYLILFFIGILGAVASY